MVEMNYEKGLHVNSLFKKKKKKISSWGKISWKERQTWGKVQSSLTNLGTFNCLLYCIFGLYGPWNGFWEQFIFFFSLTKVVWHLENFSALPCIGNGNISKEFEGFQMSDLPSLKMEKCFKCLLCVSGHSEYFFFKFFFLNQVWPFCFLWWLS